MTFLLCVQNNWDDNTHTYEYNNPTTGNSAGRVQTWSPSAQICSSSNTQHVLLCIHQIDTAAQYCSYTRSFRCPLRTKRSMPTIITIHTFMQSYYCLISRPRNHNHIQMGTPRASKDWGMLRRSGRVPILPITPTTSSG